MGLGAIGTAHLDAAWLVAGVFCGSMAWWFILTSTISLFNTNMNARSMRWINRLSGTLLAGFGLLALMGRL
jgi:threonine/homoserine/homoserine lactone efflux protein